MNSEELCELEKTGKIQPGVYSTPSLREKLKSVQDQLEAIKLDLMENLAGVTTTAEIIEGFNIKDYMNDEMAPEDVFGYDELSKWAEAHGWKEDIEADDIPF